MVQHVQVPVLESQVPVQVSVPESQVPVPVLESQVPVKVSTPESQVPAPVPVLENGT